MSPRDTLYLNGRYLSQTVTGVQRHASELVRALDRRLARDGAVPFAVTVLAPPDARDEPTLRATTVRRVGRLTGQAWEQVELPWHARHGILMSFANTAPLAHARQAVTLHDASVYAVPEAYSTLFGAWYRFLFPRLGRRAAAIATDSAFSRGELARYIGIDPARVTVVPCGCEHVLAQPADPGALERAGLAERPFILASGGDRPHKNLALVERAMSLLGDAAPALAVLGAPNPRVFGSSAAMSRAIGLGHVTDAQLRALYEQARCLVYPSWYEGFGLPPLEAMACGCPVIVARAGSLVEVCGDAARYVEPHDAEGLAAAIRTMLADERYRSSLREAGFARARLYSWDRAAELTLAIARGLTVRAGRA